jgi:CRISPR/Cas system-associated exonuclease Cas4 (RecB family)
MWIRSQNKEVLVDVTSIFVKEYTLNDYSIIDKISNLKIGDYKTEERAIEILDEIHRFLEDKQPSHPDSFTCVYQMPQE